MNNTIFKFIWFMVLLARGAADDAAICSDAGSGLEVACPQGSVIQISSSTVAYVQRENPCEASNLASLVAATPGSCKLGQEEATKQCHGEESCVLEPDLVIEILGYCSLGSFATNVLHITYSCANIENDNTAVLPLYSPVVGSSISVFSPGTPDVIPSGRFSFSCEIKPVSTSIVSFTVDIKTQLARFPGSTPDCTEELTFGGLQSTIKYCNYYPGLFLLNRSTRQTVQQNSFTLNYSKRKTGVGGKFWLQFDGLSNGAPIDLRISCLDQSQIPGFDAGLVQTTTTTATTTSTSTTTTSTTTIAIKTITTTETMVNPDQSSTTIQSIDLPKSTTTDEDNKIPDGKSKQTQSEENHQDFVLYIIIGGPVVLVLLVAVIIFIKCRRPKQRGGALPEESVDQGDILRENKSNTARETNCSSLPTYEEIAELNGVYQNIPPPVTSGIPGYVRYEAQPSNNFQNGNMDGMYERPMPRTDSTTQNYDHIRQTHENQITVRESF